MASTMVRPQAWTPSHAGNAENGSPWTPSRSRRRPGTGGSRSVASASRSGGRRTVGSWLELRSCRSPRSAHAAARSSLPPTSRASAGARMAWGTTAGRAGERTCVALRHARRNVGSGAARSVIGGCGSTSLRIGFVWSCSRRRGAGTQPSAWRLRRWSGPASSAYLCARLGAPHANSRRAQTRGEVSKRTTMPATNVRTGSRCSGSAATAMKRFTVRRRGLG